MHDKGKENQFCLEASMEYPKYHVYPMNHVFLPHPVL